MKHNTSKKLSQIWVLLSPIIQKYKGESLIQDISIFFLHNKNW